MIIRNERQAMPEILGDARRRFYDIYTLVRHALPDDASHQALCELLDTLASAAYTNAHDDKGSMERRWEGQEPDSRRRAYRGR